MKLSNCCNKNHFLIATLLALPAMAQPPILTVENPPKLVVNRTENPVLSLKIALREGYHANSNTPSEAYMIPFRLTWEPGALEVPEVTYPKAKLEKYSFSEGPISVFGGAFEVQTKFKRAANPALGPGFLVGKLRYQACNDQMCFPPKTVEVKVPLLVQ